MNKIFKKTLWTISKGKTYGYIQDINSSGYIIYNDNINLNVTTSNLLCEGNLNEFSINKLPKDIQNNIEYLMVNKIPVCIYYSIHLFGSPFKGNLLYPYYVENITTLHDEIIYNKNKSIL
jgi:hypothetical protein